MQLPELSVIGMGRLGGALTRAFCRAGLPVRSVYSRSKVTPPEGFSISGTFPAKKTQLGKLVFITVSDSAIEEVSRQLAHLHSDFSSYTFVHCSGNEPADLLSSLRNKNAWTASFHPLQTFTPQSGPETFRKIFFSMQGSSKAFPLLRKVADRIGAQAFEASHKQKETLHAAAVMASNYLITLLESAVETGAVSGLPEDQVKKVLFPLIETTLKNTRTGSFREMLTGPLMRGDIQTVENHLGLLQDFPGLSKIYRTLGSKTLELAATAGHLTPDQVEALRDTLNSPRG